MWRESYDQKNFARNLAVKNIAWRELLLRGLDLNSRHRDWLPGFMTQRIADHLIEAVLVAVLCLCFLFVSRFSFREHFLLIYFPLDAVLCVQMLFLDSCSSQKNLSSFLARCSLAVLVEPRSMFFSGGLLLSSFVDNSREDFSSFSRKHSSPIESHIVRCYRSAQTQSCHLWCNFTAKRKLFSRSNWNLIVSRF